MIETTGFLIETQKVPASGWRTSFPVEAQHKQIPQPCRTGLTTLIAHTQFAVQERVNENLLHYFMLFIPACGG